MRWAGRGGRSLLGWGRCPGPSPRGHGQVLGRLRLIVWAPGEDTLPPHDVLASSPLHTSHSCTHRPQTRFRSLCTLVIPPRHTRHTHCTFVFAGGMWGVLSIPNPPKTWRGVSYTHSAGDYKKPPHLQHRIPEGGGGMGLQRVRLWWAWSGQRQAPAGGWAGAGPRGVWVLPLHLWAAVCMVMRPNTGMHACVWMCDCTCCARGLCLCSFYVQSRTSS